MKGLGHVAERLERLDGVLEGVEDEGEGEGTVRLLAGRDREADADAGVDGDGDGGVRHGVPPGPG
jgi:hypothetical protein